MGQDTPPIEYAHAPVHASKHSGALITSAVLCFIGALFPLGWLVIQAGMRQRKELVAAFSGLRLPFGFLLLEEGVCALGMCALLIVSGTLLCVRSRWAIHWTGAAVGIALVGATGATVAEGIRRFSDDSPMNPASDHVIEIAIRAVTGVLWPMLIALPLSLESARAAVVARRGSTPATPVLRFVAGAVLVWFGLAATSLHEQAIPAAFYFARLYDGEAVTLWRVGFAAAWVIAGVLVLWGSRVGWFLALVVTLAAILSDVMLASAGGTDAVIRQLRDTVGFSTRLALTMEGRGDHPWLEALSRGAATLCLLGLLIIAACERFLFEDVPDAPPPLPEIGSAEAAIDVGPAAPREP